MKTKEGVIKEAWGDYWDSFKDRINENGWYDYRGFSEVERRSNYCQFEPLDLEEHPNHSWIRPVSLKGLDDNNGWIRIESEEDLKLDRGYYWFKWNSADGEEIVQIAIVDSKGINLYQEPTHYQPIVKPLKPIY